MIMCLPVKNAVRPASSSAYVGPLPKFNWNVRRTLYYD